jgi:hypothetical protein
MKNIITQEGKNNIDAFCKANNIENYTINGDGSIDVSGDIYFMTNYTKIPIKFNVINGRFHMECNHLTTLENAPSKVIGDFVIMDNKLSSLEGCPGYVEGDFNCQVNRLTSLKGGPGYVGGSYICGHNYLTSLEYLPSGLKGEMYFEENNFSNNTLNINEEENDVLVKYIKYYDVFDPEFNLDNLIVLIEEIKDGLL